ncbi:MAG: T9SS type A sorting domain-containing protein, partial [Flavobacteriales bacterium]
CGTTYCNIFNTDFSCSYLGTGVEYQFRFVTDNGATEFCTAWSSSPVFSSATLPYSNYFRYNKIYQVYYRARKCNTNPNWCGPCVVSTCGLPYVSVNAANCCIWRNKGNGGTINATPIAGMDQYRFRFPPVDPCSTTPYLPTGPAVSTNWNNSFAVNPTNVAVTPGQIYMVQVQCRVLSTTATSCSGTSISLPSQQSDWGPPCFIGFRVSTSPPVGTALTCCSYSMITLEELNNLLRDETEWNQEFIPFEGQSKPSTNLLVQNSSANQLSLSWDYGFFQHPGSITLTDMMGREIAQRALPNLVDQNQHELQWNESLAQGVYIVRITDGMNTLTRKVFIASH